MNAVVWSNGLYRILADVSKALVETLRGEMQVNHLQSEALGIHAVPTETGNEPLVISV